MEINKIKVRDHCHYTGKYRGASHSICNLKFSKANFTPVFLANCDAHLVIKNLGKEEDYISCIPNNAEKYISFTIEIELRKYICNGEEKSLKHQIRFVDSYKFMASSLDWLVKNLPKEKMLETKRFFGDIDLVSRKGFFPYEWMDSFEKFGNTLPPIENIYSSFNDVGISLEDYQHACNIWERFVMKNMGNYHDLYFKTDVLLLADVFEEFRKVCMENYEHDPAWYYTAPGLAWDAALNWNKVRFAY